MSQRAETVDGNGFDELIHAPNRLQICAFLAGVAEMEFQTLREQLDVSESVLSKHLKSLEDAGYVVLVKRRGLGRPRTWIAFSAQGRRAYARHVQALMAIVSAEDR
jgi:DNA-binding transcriptional ArsR family regulator